MEFIVDWFGNNPDGLLRFSVVWRAIGIASAANFKDDVRRHSDFIEALANQGIVETRIGRGGFMTLGF